MLVVEPTVVMARCRSIGHAVEMAKKQLVVAARLQDPVLAVKCVRSSMPALAASRMDTHVLITNSICGKFDTKTTTKLYLLTMSPCGYMSSSQVSVASFIQ